MPFVRHWWGVRFRRTNPQEAIYELFWDKYNSLFLLSVRVKKDVRKTGFRVTLTKNSPTFVTSIL